RGLRPIRRGDPRRRPGRAGARRGERGRSRAVRRSPFRSRHPLARRDLQGGRPMNAQPQTEKRAVSRTGTAKAAWIVAEREISTKLRSKSFLISSAVLLLFVLGGVLFSGFMANSGGFGGDTRVVAVGEAEQAVAPLDGNG